MPASMTVTVVGTVAHVCTPHLKPLQVTAPTMKLWVKTSSLSVKEHLSSAAGVCIPHVLITTS